MSIRITHPFLAGLALLAIVLAAPPQLLHAQPACPLSMHVTYIPVQALTIADVDLEHFQSHRLLYMFQIANPTDSVVNAQLAVAISVRLSNGSVNEPEGVTLLTKLFPVPPGGRTVTNLNLGRSGSDIESQEFHILDIVKEKVQDVALATGKFPAGIYLVRPRLVCENGGIAACPDCDRPIEFDLQNPSRVELRSPSDGETTGEFPFFDFYSDGTRNILTVAEKDPGQSREDAITRRPPMVETELNNVYSFLYAGGRPLEAGKTYVWRVVSRSLGAGNADLDVSSPVGLFTVSANGGGGRFSDALLEQLEEMFGRRYPDLFRQIRNGSFRFSGQFSRDGSPLDENGLLMLLNELRANPDAVDLSFE